MIGLRRNSERPSTPLRAGLAVAAILVVAYIAVAFVLTDYGSVWTQPEEFEWRPYILMDGSAVTTRDLRKGLNWRVFEYEPRSTRPLSHYFEILDTKFRAALWAVVLPHPSLSLTWIFLLVVTPVVFYKLLRDFDVPPVTAGALTAWYVANPGTLSLAAADFRPAKALANFAIVCCLFGASHLNRRQREGASSGDARFYGLYVFMLVSFFVDETALLSFPSVAVLFPKLVFRNVKRSAAFLVLPIVTYLMYFHGIPALTTMAGFEAPVLAAYGPAKAVTTFEIVRYILLSPKGLSDLGTNLTIFLSDMFGLVNPALSRTWVYTLLWGAVVACLAAAIVRIGLVLHRRGWRTAVRRDVLQSLLLLAGVTVFANFTIHLVNNLNWGLHWLNTYWPIFWLLFLALLLKPIDLPPVFTLVAASLIITASVYDFTAVNRAFKTFFYYRTFAFEDVISHKINRFEIPRFDGMALRQRTRTIWRGHAYAARIEGIPSELYYLVPDLALVEPGVTHGRQGTLFTGHEAVFDLVRERGMRDKYFVVHPTGWARHVNGSPGENRADRPSRP